MVRLNKIVSIIYILYSIFLLGCSNKTKPLKSYGQLYNNFSMHQDFIGTKIDLDSFKIYEELLEYIRDAPCKDILPYFKITNQNNICGIYPLTFRCGDIPPPWHPLERNTFYTKENGIFKNNKYIKSDSLEFILKKNYDNNGELDDYAEKPEKILFIFEYYKESPLGNINSQLIQITNVYDKIKPEANLYMLFSHTNH